jgi:hypothetical protein
MSSNVYVLPVRLRDCLEEVLEILLVAEARHQASSPGGEGTDPDTAA